MCERLLCHFSGPAGRRRREATSRGTAWLISGVNSTTAAAATGVFVCRYVIYIHFLSFFLSFFLDVIPPSQEEARDQTASQQRRLYCCVPGNLEKWASMSSRKKEEKEKKAKGKKRERRDGYRRWWEIQATIPLRTSKRRKEIKRALAPVNCLLVEAGPSPLPVMRVSKHFIWLQKIKFP